MTMWTFYLMVRVDSVGNYVVSAIRVVFPFIVNHDSLSIECLERRNECFSGRRLQKRPGETKHSQNTGTISRTSVRARAAESRSDTPGPRASRRPDRVRPARRRRVPRDAPAGDRDGGDRASLKARCRGLGSRIAPTRTGSG